MNILKFLPAYLSILLLPGCWPFPKPTAENQTQAHIIFSELRGPLFSHLQQAVVPIINTIIQQELGVEPEAQFPVFLPKKRFNLTIYYLDGYCIGQEQVMIQAIDQLQKQHAELFAIATAGITLRADFFGDKHDELVLLVDDAQGSLSALHDGVKQVMTQANVDFKQTHPNDLYDKAKSERYSYVPHISLGRLQTELFQKWGKGKKGIMGAIKKRIEQEVYPLIASILSKDTNTFSISNLCLYDPQPKECLKRYAFKRARRAR